MQPNKKTMPTPKISVIVPVYNAEKSLLFAMLNLW